MPSVSFTELQGLADVLLNDRYELLITPGGGGVGGAGGPTGGDAALRLRCQQVAFPGGQVEPVLVGLNGMNLNYRGRKLWTWQMAVTFVEYIDGTVWGTLKSWQESIVGSTSGNGTPKATYATTGTLNIMDEAGNPAQVAIIESIWPSDVPDVQIDGTQAGPFLVNAVFTYDRAYYGNAPAT